MITYLKNELYDSINKEIILFMCNNDSKYHSIGPNTRLLTFLLFVLKYCIRFCWTILSNCLRAQKTLCSCLFHHAQGNSDKCTQRTPANFLKFRTRLFFISCFCLNGASDMVKWQWDIATWLQIPKLASIPWVQHEIGERSQLRSSRAFLIYIKLHTQGRFLVEHCDKS